MAANYRHPRPHNARNQRAAAKRQNVLAFDEQRIYKMAINDICEFDGVESTQSNSQSNCSNVPCSDERDSLQQITAKWVDSVLKHYAGHNNLTQVHARGFFSGMSEREIVDLANHLKSNAEKYPVWNS